MTKFAYNYAKNTNTSHILLELNYSYYFYVFFEDNINPCSKSSSTNKPAKELKDLISIY